MYYIIRQHWVSLCSCVGFSNHKSHIKRNVRSCRLANHLLEKDHDLVRDKNPKEFDLSPFKGGGGGGYQPIDLGSFDFELVPGG